MNKIDFVNLCFNYNKEPNEELFELWKYNLRMFSEKEIKDAISHIMMTEKYFPNLYKIVEVIKEIIKTENFDYNEKKYLKEKMKKHNIKPEWLDKIIINEFIDKETEETFNDFQNYLKNI